MPVRRNIQEGDSIIRIAQETGLFAGTIWGHPGNADLRMRRKNMNLLEAGDVLTIPDKTPKKLPAPTDRRHRYHRKGIPAVFRVQIVRDGSVYANQPYRLVVGDKSASGNTDGDGVVEQFVNPEPTSGTLFLGPDQLEVAVLFGNLDPLNEVSGMQKRLRNLAFYAGEPDGKLGPETKFALATFQNQQGLKPTGMPDAKTLVALETVHDRIWHPPEPQGPPPKAIDHGR